MKNALRVFALLVPFLCLTTIASAQSIFALPGTGGSFTTIPVYSAATLGSTGNFPASQDSYSIVGLPDGSKYYAISASGTGTVTAVSSNFTNPLTLGNFNTQASGAVVTPDGKWLYVAAGNLQVINTSTNQNVFTSGGLPVGGTAMDVAADLDGSRVFVLVSTVSGYLLKSYATNTNVQLGSVPVQGAPTGIAVGPNGLIYVSTHNLVEELDPTSLDVLSEYAIPGTTARLQFTPDGQRAISVNANPTTGSVFFVLNLITKKLESAAGFASIVSNDTLTSSLVAGNNLAYGLSAQSHTLYQISLNPVNITIANFGIVQPPNVTSTVTAMAISNEAPLGGRTSANSLYFATTANTLYKIDLAGGATPVTAPLTNAAKGLSYATPAATDPPAALFSFGGNQLIATNQTSSPLVVQAIDAAGHPLIGVNISFSTTGGVLSATSATTGSGGYAQVTLAAPATTGTVTVTGRSGGYAASLNVIVASASSGGGVTTSLLHIIEGDGQLLRESTETALFGSSLQVQATNTNGNPLPNASVTYTLTSGSLTLQSNGIPILNNSVTLTADSNGLAAIDILTPSVSPSVAQQASTVTATVAGGGSAVFHITAYSANLGATTLLLSPAPGTILTGQAGTVLTGAIQLVVSLGTGAPVPNVGIRLLTDAGPHGTRSKLASCNGNPVSNSKGVINCDVLLGPSQGDGTVTPAVGYFETLRAVSLSVTPGGPAAIKITSGNNQSAKTGTTLPALTATITDISGTALASVPVMWQVLTGSATLSGQSTTTSANGQATAMVTLGNTAGTVQIKLTAGGLSVTFTETATGVVVGSGQFTVVSGGGQSALPNAAFTNPLITKVLDGNGNVVAGASVSFAVTSGSATVAQLGVTPFNPASVQATVTAGPTPGPVVITASYGALQVTFALTVLPVTPPPPIGPSNIKLTNGASFNSRGAGIGSVAPGEILTITGQGIVPNLAGVVFPEDGPGPLATSLEGVEVQFGGIAGPILSVSNVGGVQQVNVQVPFELAPGTTSLTITVTGGGSATLNNVAVAPNDPGIFEFAQSGKQYGVVIHADGSYVTPQNPAHPGETLQMFATGLGAGITPTVKTGAVGVPGETL